MKKDWYFLDCDDDGHDYLIPSSRRKDWNEWLNLDRDEELSWVVPSYAKRLEYSISHVEFPEFREYSQGM